LPTAGGSFFWLSGTTDELLNSGFLWVIWDGSTFLRPEVTDPPLLRAARRAPAPAALPAAAAALGADDESEGGGGGGGAAAEGVDEGTEDGAGSPWGSAQANGKKPLAYFWIPGHTGSVILLDIFLQSIEKLREGLCPSDSSWITTYQLKSKEKQLTYVSLNCLVTRSAQNWAAFFISPT
jgi:hypothetical protein